MVKGAQWVYQVKTESSAPSWPLSAVCWIQPLIRFAGHTLPPLTSGYYASRLPPHLPHTSYSLLSLLVLLTACISTIQTQSWRCPARMQPSWLSSLCSLHFPVSLMQKNVGFGFLFFASHLHVNLYIRSILFRHINDGRLLSFFCHGEHGGLDSVF